MIALFKSFRVLVILNALVGLSMILPHILTAMQHKDHAYTLYPFIPDYIMAVLFYFNALLFIVTTLNLFFIFNEFLNREKPKVVMFTALIYALDVVVFFSQVIYLFFMNTFVDGVS